MISPAKIEANRRNALKSTGPKTERGKERARLNALRHGMRAKELVARDEYFVDFGRFSAELSATLKPCDAFEAQLVEDIVMSSWRLRRVWRAEGAVMQRAAHSAESYENPKLAPVPFMLANQPGDEIVRCHGSACVIAGAASL